MATWAINGPVPCEVVYTEEYHEEPTLSVFVEDEGAFIEVHGLDESVRIYLTLDHLGPLTDALDGAWQFLTEADDGDTDSDGVGGKYTGVDHLAGTASGSP